jgi:hypothetical protein
MGAARSRPEQTRKLPQMITQVMCRLANRHPLLNYLIAVGNWLYESHRSVFPRVVDVLVIDC